MKWNDDKGFGFLKATEPCTKDYWAEYRELDKTPLGRVLTMVRIAMVYAFADETKDWPVVDVGIGGGAFVDKCGDCYGTDIGKEALAWLEEHELLWDGESVPVMTFWDSLEHIENPGPLLAKATKLVYVSTPIYRDQAHARASKHYKPNEHLWYFTDHGLHMFMREYGFKCVEQNEIETDAGREGIGSYVFKRA